MAMGIGRLGDPKLVIKRKFRWTIEINTPIGLIPKHFAKVAARPQLDIDELEVNFLNATTWLPGKGKWQPLNVTYIDVADAEMGPLYSWIASVYDFTQINPQSNLPQTEKPGWNGSAVLTMYDGCGSPLEQWTLNSCWPQSINFGDLDYSDSNEATIDLTLRFSEVNYMKLGNCGITIDPDCKGCVQ